MNMDSSPPALTSTERRKKNRQAHSPSVNIFIEITHPFGATKKALYAVSEFDAHGVSFLIPSQDGYFLPGTPLQYTLSTHDERHTQNYGTVRYYHHIADNSGKTFYKVGLEADCCQASDTHHAIRPRRYSLLSTPVRPTVSFMLNGTNHSFELVDISDYSAAFDCPQDSAADFRVGHLFSDTSITMANATIFSGTVSLKRIQKAAGNYRVVLEPRNETFNTGVVQLTEHLSEFSHALESLSAATRNRDTLPGGFKELLADMNACIGHYRSFFSSPRGINLSRQIEDRDLLSEAEKKFYPEYDQLVGQLDAFVRSLSPSEELYDTMRKYFQSIFHPQIIQGTFLQRVFSKPFGYPGDFEMMRMIRDFDYGGPDPVSRLIDRHALLNPLAQSNRNRIGYLAQTLANCVAASLNRTVNILSVASGAAFEIVRLIQTHPDLANRINLTCVDQEPRSLRYAQESIYRERILKSSDIQVSFEEQSIASFLRRLGRGRLGLKNFDIIYVFGLFDYFDDRLCRFSVSNLLGALNPGGSLMVSNYSLDGHYHRTYMEFAFEWFMYYRTEQQMLAMAEGLPQIDNLVVESEETQVIKFLRMQRR